jgi:hypothetical protein
LFLLFGFLIMTVGNWELTENSNWVGMENLGSVDYNAEWLAEASISHGGSACIKRRKAHRRWE